MSQLFDLNVHNYSLQELLDFFGLTTNNNATSVDRTCDALKQKIKEDPKLGPVTKGKIHDFLVSKSGTIMTNSFGMAIGFALKDFIAAIVVNLFKPLNY